MNCSAAVISSLEAVAERGVDPTEAIYHRLFQLHPELERLFEMDDGGAVRGSMVQTAIECVLDHAGPKRTARNVIAAERQHHDGYGVPAERFDDLFIAMRDVIRDLLGEDWTRDMETGWNGLIEDFAAMRL